MEIDGFPVPPNSPYFETNRGISLWLIIGAYERNLLASDVEIDDIFAAQSIGFRAWMDEAERIRESLDVFYKTRGMPEVEYDRQESEAIANAERCRTWRAK